MPYIILVVILVVIFITIIWFIVVRQYHNSTQKEKSKGQDYNSDGNKSQENAKEPEPESKDFYSYPDNEFFSEKEIIKSEEENRNTICEDSNLKLKSDFSNLVIEETIKENTQPEYQNNEYPESTNEINHRRAPLNRGGRPRRRERNLSVDSTGENTEIERSIHHRIDIVCLKRERQWIAAVEIPEELLEKPGLEVFQAGERLTQEQENCWCLEQAFGEVVIQWNESEGVQEIKVALGQDGYLLFKLSDQHQDQGRRVQFPSSGSYLVMVPDDWVRDDTLSGPPPVEPESVFLTGYKAHFFELERGGERKIAFRIPTGELIKIETNALRLELVGKHLCDATEKIGPLFGERPPQIRALDSQAWKNVRTIVVGEEGSGKERWRIAFNPVSEQVEQELPLELVARKGGWYFLRFYDTNDELIESLDFRFLCALKEIRIPQLSPLPPEDGHKQVCVEFLHDTGCAVQPVGPSASIQIERQDDKTTLTIPPDPACDETRWCVGVEGGPQVEVTILVERVWWGIGEEQNAPSEWKDRPLTLQREDFAATSNKALWLRLPRRRWVDEILVGFEQSTVRSYIVEVTHRTVAIPLCEFCDSREVGDRTQKYTLKVWIKRGDNFIQGTVGVIPVTVEAPERRQAVSPQTTYWVGFGRKKTALAKAVLQYGSARIEVNKLPVDEYFKDLQSKAKRFLYRLLELDRVHDILSQMEVLITVTGSDPTTTRQAKAVAHALARALISYDPNLRPLLKQAGFGGVRVEKQPKYNRRIYR